MRKLSKYEKETIINWNEAENLASIYTFNASLKRRLAEFSRKYPLLCRLERSTPEGSVTYVLDKSRLSIRFIPPYSEERKAAASPYAKEMCIRDRNPAYGTRRQGLFQNSRPVPSGGKAHARPGTKEALAGPRQAPAAPNEGAGNCAGRGKHGTAAYEMSFPFKTAFFDTSTIDISTVLI